MFFLLSIIAVISTDEVAFGYAEGKVMSFCLLKVMAVTQTAPQRARLTFRKHKDTFFVVFVLLQLCRDKTHTHTHTLLSHIHTLILQF